MSNNSGMRQHQAWSLYDDALTENRHLEVGNLIHPREDGGAERDRTDDLLLAKQALSQLSYSPEYWSGAAADKAPTRRLSQRSTERDGGPGKIWTSDLTLIKRAL
jgi:hypothetical protein